MCVHNSQQKIVQNKKINQDFWRRANSWFEDEEEQKTIFYWISKWLVKKLLFLVKKRTKKVFW